MFHKLELDVMQANELVEASQLATKHKFPAMVVHPMIATEALMARGMAQGGYKIIIPVDWPKGSAQQKGIFGMPKLRGLSTDALDADGFEILLTGGKTISDTRKEAQVITDFIKTQLAETIEVRFVLGAFFRTEEVISGMCEALQGVRAPSYIRTDHQLKLQVSKASADAHNHIMDLILSNTKAPIKLSGNISTVRTITSCGRAQRFAVNVLQAKAIIKEYHQQPQELRQMLDV